MSILSHVGFQLISRHMISSYYIHFSPILSLTDSPHFYILNSSCLENNQQINIGGNTREKDNNLCLAIGLAASRQVQAACEQQQFTQQCF